MRVWEGGGSFLDRLKADAEVAETLSVETLESLFDPAFHTRHVDTIFERVFGRR